MERAIGDYRLAPPRAGAPAKRFILISLGLAFSAAILAGRMPLQMSIAVVFLFAGPHNWMELRYFISRMPVRWAASRNFFILAIAGATTLTGLYAAFPLAARRWGWSDAGWLTSIAIWNSLMVLWVI